MMSLFSNIVLLIQDGIFFFFRRQNLFVKFLFCVLYDLFIVFMEGGLMYFSGFVGWYWQFILVLEGEFYFIFFVFLKGSFFNEYFYECFGFFVVFFICFFSVQFKFYLWKNLFIYFSFIFMVVVIGNFKFLLVVMDRWLWGFMLLVEEEVYMVFELLGCQFLVGSVVIKERVMSVLIQVECVYFVIYIFWKLLVLVFMFSMDGNFVSSKSFFGYFYMIFEFLWVQDDVSDGESILDCLFLQELLFMVVDVLDLQLFVKLVVFGFFQEFNSKVIVDGVIVLIRVFLVVGVQCVFVFLWFVLVVVFKMFIYVFYLFLLNGLKVSVVLGEVMKVVQSSKVFLYFFNWVGFMFIGSDVKLNSFLLFIGQVFIEILQYLECVWDVL